MALPIEHVTIYWELIGDFHWESLEQGGDKWTLMFNNKDGEPDIIDLNEGANDAWSVIPQNWIVSVMCSDRK